MSSSTSTFETEPSVTFVATTYTLSVASILFFTALALILAYKSNKRQLLDTEAFLTARGTQSWLRIGWSFFAGSMGAWVITLPLAYAVTLGYWVIPAYAISIGLPCILVAYLGKYLQMQLPKPLSLTDFTHWRFGKVVHFMVIGLCLLNMSLALVSEYAVLSSIFRDYLATASWPIMFLMGVCTLLYSVYGGLATSIMTDQFQGIGAVLFTCVLAIYLAATFRPELPELPERLKSRDGAWSFFTLIVSISSTVLYSECFWQRVWASKTLKDTKKASLLAFFFSFVVITFFGICGLLAAWAYDVKPDNLIVFRLLPNKFSWVGSFLVFSAVVMNQGCIDSLQNGLAATLAATFCKDRTLCVTRFVLIFVNVPCLVVGYMEPDVLKLYLLSNLITSCAFLPMVLGLLDVHQRFIGWIDFIVSFVFGICAVTLHGLAYKNFDFVEGILWGWWENDYNGYVFLSLLMGSCLGIFVSMLCSRKIFCIRAKEV